MTVLVLHLWCSEGRLTSACRARVDEDLKAPKAILRTVFWTTSSCLRRIEEAKPYNSNPQSNLHSRSAEGWLCWHTMTPAQTLLWYSLGRQEVLRSVMFCPPGDTRAIQRYSRHTLIKKLMSINSCSPHERPQHVISWLLRYHVLLVQTYTAWSLQPSVGGTGVDAYQSFN